MYWNELWAKAEYSPPLTAQQFDLLSPKIKNSAAAKALARRVLVDGQPIKEVAAAAQKHHGYVSRPVCQYRIAHEQYADSVQLNNG